MKSLTARIRGEVVIKALREDKVLTIAEGGGIKVEGEFEGGQVFVVGHNKLDVWTGMCSEERAREFKKAIEEAYKPGVEVILVCCYPARLPEELKKYTLDGESDYGWTAADLGEETLIREDKEDGADVLEKEFEVVRAERRELVEREDVKKWIEEWGLDWRYVREEVKYLGEKKFVTWVYKKRYIWEGNKWKVKGENAVLQRRSYGEELWVICDAPELGYMTAESI